MKFFITFTVALIASTAQAGVVVSPAVAHVGLANTGSSAVSRTDDGLGNYAFGYNEDHATGGTFRKEQGGPGVQVGSYGLRDADGRVRTVNYVADALGFRASVSTNEPGVDAGQAPAATSVNGPVLTAAAPVALAAPVAAPLAVAAAPALAHASYAVAAPAVAHTSYAVAAPAVAHTSYAVAAPTVAVAPVQASSYSVSTQHVSAAAPVAVAAHAPVALAAHAPVAVAHGAPLATSYSVQTRTLAAPGHAVLAAPYATKSHLY